MTLALDTTTVKVKEHIPNLAWRIQCDALFRYIESLPAERIIVDFEGFDCCSRSFVHQYLMNKEKSSKRIEETNMSRFLTDMFSVVRRQIERARSHSI
jgi:hypothetical protein